MSADKTKWNITQCIMLYWYSCNSNGSCSFAIRYVHLYTTLSTIMQLTGIKLINSEFGWYNYPHSICIIVLN
jgi:hypothetical protein